MYRLWRKVCILTFCTWHVFLSKYHSFIYTLIKYTHVSKTSTKVAASQICFRRMYHLEASWCHFSSHWINDRARQPHYGDIPARSAIRLATLILESRRITTGTHGNLWIQWFWSHAVAIIIRMRCWYFITIIVLTVISVKIPHMYGRPVIYKKKYHVYHCFVYG